MGLSTIPKTAIACGCGAASLRTTWRRQGWVRFDLTFMRRGQVRRGVKYLCAACAGRVAGQGKGHCED